MNGNGINLQDILVEQLKPSLIETFKEYLEDSKTRQLIVETLDPNLKSQLNKTTSSKGFKTEFINNISDDVLDLARDYLSNYSLSIKNVQVYDGETLVTEVTDARHNEFEKLLKITMPGIFCFIKGPAGCGKTKCIQQIANALGKDFYPISAPQNVQDLIGFIDANGRYVETDFYKAFTNGGIVSLEEIDISDPVALKVCNNAFGDGFCKFPIGTKYVHKDFICFVSANTFGTGRSAEYVGNTRLDAATLNRFFVVTFDYDKELERLLYPDDEILELFWALRDSAQRNNIKAIFSTRGIGICYNLRHKSNPLDDESIINGTIIKGLNIDDINALKSSIKIDSHKNLFYKSFLYCADKMSDGGVL